MVVNGTEALAGAGALSSWDSSCAWAMAELVTIAADMAFRTALSSHSCQS